MIPMKAQKTIIDTLLFQSRRRRQVRSLDEMDHFDDADRNLLFDHCTHSTTQPRELPMRLRRLPMEGRFGRNHEET